MKKLLYAMLLFAFCLAAVPAASAETVTVTTYEGLKAAAASADVDTIEIGADIEVEDTVQLYRSLTIRSAGEAHHKLSLSSGASDGTAVLQFGFTDGKLVMEGLTISGGTDRGVLAYISGSVSIKDCVFSDNSSKSLVNLGGGSGLCLVGMGALSADITNCAFLNNSSPYTGGGLFLAMVEANITRCTFSGNSARDGGGLFARSVSALNLSNSTFTGNKATQDGGALDFDISTTANVVNCTFFSNTAANGAEIHSDDSGSTFKAANSIFWNAGSAYISSEAPVSLYNCAYGDGAFNSASTGAVTSADCVANLNWAGRTSRDLEIANVTQMVFPLEDDADAALIDTGLTADEIKAKLNLDWTPNLKIDQLGFERRGKPDFGAMERFEPEGGDDGLAPGRGSPSSGCDTGLGFGSLVFLIGLARLGNRRNK